MNTIKTNNNIYVSRHGESLGNVENILSHTISSSEKYPLTKKWIQDTEQEAKSHDIHLDIIITSPLLRTKQTAELYQQHLWGEIVIDDRLIERSDGIFDNEYLTKYLERYKSWDKDLRYDSVEGWENHTQVLERIISLLKTIEHTYKNKNILLVSHGTPSTILYNYANNLPLPIENSGIDFPKNKIIKVY